MNKETRTILRCLSILLSDPDGNNGQRRMALMKEIKDLIEEKSKDFEFKESLTESASKKSGEDGE